MRMKKKLKNSPFPSLGAGNDPNFLPPLMFFNPETKSEKKFRSGYLFQG